MSGSEVTRPALEAVERLLRDVGPSLMDTRRGGLIPGASLILLAECHRHGIEIVEPALGVVAHWLRLSPVELQEIEEFYRVLLASDQSGPPITLCLGTSCKLRGALTFHARMRAYLLERSSQYFAEKVFCLGQCDRGPSIMVGNRIYCSSEQRVVVDDRQWRPGDAGPVPISNGERPRFG